MAPERYTLRPAALRDLENIWKYSARTWSVAQAETYSRKLFAAFELLTRNPELGRLRAEYTPPVRIYRCEAHMIIYQNEGPNIEIIRIRHGREDWASDPASG